MKSTAVKSVLGNPLCERSIRDKPKLKIIKSLRTKQLTKDIWSILKSKKRLRNIIKPRVHETNYYYLQLPPYQKLMKDFDF